MVDNVQQHINCNNLQSSQTFRSYSRYRLAEEIICDFSNTHENSTAIGPQNISVQNSAEEDVM
jgi:hypothetical protein